VTRRDSKSYADLLKGPSKSTDRGVGRERAVVRPASAWGAYHEASEARRRERAGDACNPARCSPRRRDLLSLFEAAAALGPVAGIDCPVLG
jgi:hypothetical protein